MNLRKTATEKLFVSFTILTLMNLQAFAVGSGGYENQVPSARAMGRANSMVASVDDASAVFFNPARLTAIGGGDLSVGLTLQNVKTEYEGATQSDASDSDTGISPNFHVAHNFGLEKFAFGFGIDVPHGLASKWPTSGVISPIYSKGDLIVLDFNPAVGYKLSDKLSFGAGIDFYDITSASSETNDPSAPFESKLKGDGTGLGANLGASYVINDKHMFGLSYRSGSNVEVEGTATATGYPDSNIKTVVNIPAVWQMGYGMKASEKWLVELDAQWDNWSVVNDQHVIDSDTNQTAQQNDKDWKDAWSVGIGTEYMLNPQLALRAGYGFVDSPIPNTTFEPSTPDSEIHMFTLGTGYVFHNNVTADFGLQLFMLNDRHIDNGATLAGTYKTHAEYYAFNLGYRFGRKS